MRGKSYLVNMTFDHPIPLSNDDRFPVSSSHPIPSKTRDSTGARSSMFPVINLLLEIN